MKQSKPEWWAWAACVVSVLFLAFAVILLRVPLDQMEKSLRAEDVLSSVQEHLYADARRDVRDLFSRSWGETLVESVDFTGNLIWKVDPSVPGIIELIEALRKNDTETTRRILNGSLNPIYSQEPDVSLSAQVNTLKAALMADDFNREQIAGLAAKRKKAAPEYLAARGNLRLFLGFGDDDDSSGFDPGSGESYVFYRGGVLEGLPGVPELPGEYETLADLREALSGMGVKVQVSGPDPVGDFRDKIAEIRNRAAQATALLRQLAESEREFSERRNRLEKEMAILRKGLRKAFERRLSGLLRAPALFERLISTT